MSQPQDESLRNHRLSAHFLRRRVKKSSVNKVKRSCVVETKKKPGRKDGSRSKGSMVEMWLRD